MYLMENSMKRFYLLALSTLALSSCGKEESKVEQFKYNLTENGCSTGDQSASSKEEMCNLLKSRSANNGCAFSLRKQKFEQEGCGTWSNTD
jgi:hypothetical protein